MNVGLKTKFRYRSVFISDVHLMSRDSRATILFELLDHIDSDHIYLVGDIFDLWCLKRKLYWTPVYDRIIRKIFKLAINGCRIHYIPGNHDDIFRKPADKFSFGNICIQGFEDYITLRGKKYLVIHGDVYDSIVTHHKLLTWIGSWAYAKLIYLNRMINALRRIRGKRYKSISGIIKSRVKRALKYVNNYENVLTNSAKQKGYDGVICGHIHQPAIKVVNCIDYLNCGDFVENCTFIAETDDGEFKLVNSYELLKDIPSKYNHELNKTSQNDQSHLE